MHPDTVRCDNYPITPNHLDVSGGIPDTFDNPVVEAAVVAIIQFSQTNLDGREWCSFDSSQFILGLQSKECSVKFELAMLNKLVSQELITSTRYGGLKSFLPSHKLLTMVFAKCPDVEYIHAKPSEKELIRRRHIYGG
jgi:hypothetical protein